MKNVTNISWEIINIYVRDGLLITTKHPNLNLWVLNYSKTCQFEKKWDDITIMCRGLVVDSNGKIIARPFSKFFNYEEHDSPELPNVPTNLPFEAFEKEDGSLGILFNYLGEWIIITRGSFVSDQAIKAKEMLDAKFGGNLSFLYKDKTYMFEIIYPENMIVRNYNGMEDLIMLGVIDTKTGEELSYDEMNSLYLKYFTIVKRYNGITDFSSIKECNQDNREGFVIRFSNNMKIKIKFDEYVRLHRIITNVSNKSIWESLMNNDSLEELLSNVPDEFYDWVEKTKNDLCKRHKMIHDNVLSEHKLIIKSLVDNYSEKDFAMIAKESKYSGFLFAIENGREIDTMIWKTLKPVYSKPYTNNL